VIGLWLWACTGASTGLDSGIPGDTSVDTNPDGTWFDTYAVGWDLSAGADGDGLRAAVVSGLSQEPLLEVTFYAEAWFSTQLDEHRCSWLGQVTSQQSDGLGLGSALWVGWSVGLSLVETDCAGFSPIRWGSETPTEVLEATPLGIGFGPSSQAFEDELHDALTQSGWSESDWEASFGPFLYSTWFAAPDGDGAWAAAEINMTRTYQVDDQWAVLLDDGGASVPVPVEDGLPAGYVRSQSWKLYDARAWFPVVGR